MSAGSLKTPQLLLLSGIGPSTLLKAQGIKPILDLPGVGQNLTDHPVIVNYFLVNSNATYDDILRNSSLFNAELQNYLTTGQGLFANSRANNIGFTRLPKTSTVLKKFGDPSPGPGSGHIEIIFAVSDTNCFTLNGSDFTPQGWLWSCPATAPASDG